MVQGTSVKPCGGAAPCGPRVVPLDGAARQAESRKKDDLRASSAALLLDAFEGWERAQAEAFAARRALSPVDAAHVGARLRERAERSASARRANRAFFEQMVRCAQVQRCCPTVGYDEKKP